jgi:hypothetical protein
MSHTIVPFGESHWKKWFLQFRKGEKGRLELVAPATKEEVADVENHLRFALPDSFRRVVLHYSRKLSFYWNMADVLEFQLNGEHAYKYYDKTISERPIMGGGFIDFKLYDLDAIGELREVGEDHYYLEEEEEYKHWSNSFIFTRDGAGNYFGIDMKYNPGEVIYLPKDGEDRSRMIRHGDHRSRGTLHGRSTVY